MGLNPFQWKPALLGSLVLDLDADRVAGNDGDAVATWANQAPTGSANDFTGSGTAKPLLKRNIISGHSTLLFDGVDDELTSTGTFPAGAATYFLVFKTVANPSAGNTAVVALLKTATVDHFKVLYLRNAVATFQPYDSGAKAINNGDLSVGIADALDTNAHIYGISYNNGAHNVVGSYAITLDGTSKTVAASGINAIPTTYLCTLGAVDTGAGGVACWNGHLARVLGFNTNLSTTDYAVVQQYLHARYGI